MEWLAALIWFCSLLITGAYLFRLAQADQITGLCVLSMLAAIFHVRPLLFFLRLDSPAPDWLFYDYWYLVALASAAGLAWIIVFILAHALLTLPQKAIAKLFPAADARINMKLLIVVCVLLTLFGVAINLSLIRQEGAVEDFIWAVKREKSFSGLYVIRQICVLSALVCLTALIGSARDTLIATPSRRRQLPIFLGAFLVGLIAANLGANFMWGNRFNIAMFLVVAIVAYHTYVRKISIAELVVLICLSGALLHSLRILRELIVYSGQSQETVLAQMSFLRGLSFSLHFSEYDALMLVIRDVGNLFQFRQGEDFLNGIVSWIPGFLWEGKPSTFHVGPWLRQVYEPDRINGWPVTVVGAWYVNFGIIGIFVGAMLSGLVVGALDRCYRNSHNNPWHAVLAPAFGLFLFDGGLNTGFPQYLVLYVLPIALLIGVAKWGQSGLARKSKAKSWGSVNAAIE